MKVKKILVEVDGSTTSLARLESGINLGKSLGASISALCVVPFYLPTMAMGTMHGGWYVGEQVIEERRREALTAAKEVRGACERLAKNFGTELSWLQYEGDIVTSTCQEARYHDILLVGKPDTVNEPQLRTRDINGILLSSGMPVLVVPGSIPLLDKPIKNILLAWDGSKEALQALRGAMPFLEGADSVMVVTAYKHEERRQTIEDELEKIVAYLVVHGVKASGHALEKGNFSTGDLLINYANQSETDLIVMGAYGHSRLTEIVLGGATLDMLHNATLPILFAH